MGPRNPAATPVRVTRSAFRVTKVIISLIVVFAPLTQATTIRRFTLEQVRDTARTVVLGTIVSSSRSVDPHFPTTDYQVRVSEVLRGKVSGQTMMVSYLLGEGAPHLEKDRTYVFFMGPEKNHSTVGWAQGLFRTETLSQNGKSIPVLISGDNQPLLISSNGELRRGSVVDVRDGKLKPVTTSATQWNSELPSAPGVAETAPRASAPHPAVIPQSAPRVVGYATLDDLRRFVQSGKAPRK